MTKILSEKGSVTKPYTPSADNEGHITIFYITDFVNLDTKNELFGEQPGKVAHKTGHLNSPVSVQKWNRQ